MSIYTYYGESVSSSDASVSSVKDAIISGVSDGSINLGKVVGTTLGSTVSGSLKTLIDNGYSALKTAWLNSPVYSVPFFISTDQHEGLANCLEVVKYINNIDVDGIDIVNINLGDSCANAYSPNGYLTLLLGAVKYCKNYIGVVGNHDCIQTSTQTYKSGESTKYWESTLPYKVGRVNSLCKEVYVDKHNVKFVVIDPYTNPTTGNSGLKVTGELIDWLISALSADDGYDIVGLCHENTYSTYTSRSNVSGTKVNNLTQIHTLFKARKDKTNGSVTDADGVSHSYDFRNTNTKVLCMFNGHVHAEIWNVDDFVEYSCDAWCTNGLTFGLIDRKNNKLRIWHMNTSTYTVDTELTLDI